MAGEVAVLGSGVRNWRVGDRVVLNPVVSCGSCRWCKIGRENLCDQVQLLGAHRAGGYAEYICVPTRNLHRQPSNLSFEEAAAVPLVFQTAWHMIMTLGHLQPGEWVLVMAAGSGVGSAAVQIAKLMGALVIATAGDEGKMEKARTLGADAVVNHYDPDWPKQVREITEGYGVDLLIEHVGQAVFEPCVRLLAKGGRLITCGATTGAEVQFDLRYLFSRELEIHGAYVGRSAELSRVLQLVEAGRLKPVIDSVLPLEEAQEAHQKLEARQAFGKIVLRMT